MSATQFVRHTLREVAISLSVLLFSAVGWCADEAQPPEKVQPRQVRPVEVHRNTVEGHIVAADYHAGESQLLVMHYEYDGLSPEDDPPDDVSQFVVFSSPARSVLTLLDIREPDGVEQITQITLPGELTNRISLIGATSALVSKLGATESGGDTTLQASGSHTFIVDLEKASTTAVENQFNAFAVSPDRTEVAFWFPSDDDRALTLRVRSLSEPFDERGVWTQQELNGQCFAATWNSEPAGILCYVMNENPQVDNYSIVQKFFRALQSASEKQQAGKPTDGPDEEVLAIEEELEGKALGDDVLCLLPGGDTQAASDRQPKQLSVTERSLPWGGFRYPVLYDQRTERTYFALRGARFTGLAMSKRSGPFRSVFDDDSLPLLRDGWNPLFPGNNSTASPSGRYISSVVRWHADVDPIDYSAIVVNVRKRTVYELLPEKGRWQPGWEEPHIVWVSDDSLLVAYQNDLYRYEVSPKP